jgi:hypothetical protein
VICETGHIGEGSDYAPGLLLFGIVVTFWFRPDHPLDTAMEVDGLATARNSVAAACGGSVWGSRRAASSSL